MAASQRIQSDVSQLAGNFTVRVGAFNMGIHQNMLVQEAWCKKHSQNFQRVVTKAIAAEGLHLLSCCEVGGHRQGPTKEGAHLQPLVDDMMAGMQVACEQNYVNVFHNPNSFEEPPKHRSDVTLIPRQEPEIFAIPHTKVDPQLVIWEYSVRAAGAAAAAEFRSPQAAEGTLVVGSLHVRTQTKTKVKFSERVSITKLAKLSIEHYVAKKGLRKSVKILLGDFNLTAEQTNKVCQGVEGVPNYDAQWHCQAANAGLGGDVMLISGSDSEVFDIAIGKSYDDRGMRNDSHDAFGVTVKVPVLLGDVTQLAEKASATSSATASAEEPVYKKTRNKDEGSKSEEVKAEENKAEPDIASIKKKILKSFHELEQQFLKKVRAVEQELKQMRLQNEAKKGEAVDPQKKDKLFDESDPGFTPDFSRDEAEETTAGKILREMRQWYDEHADDPTAAESWKSLSNFLYKKVKNFQEDDLWLDQPGDGQSSGDVSQPKLVVSAEFVALHVKQVIEVREKFLQARNLPLNTVMEDGLIQEFLKEAKHEYHSRPDQVQRQKQDKENRKPVAAGKKQRWSRNLQRLAGSTQMWQFLSFSGRWNPENLAHLPPVPNNIPTAEQMRKTKEAIQARATYRQAKALALHVEEKKKEAKRTTDSVSQPIGANKTLTKKTMNFLLATTMTACEKRPTHSPWSLATAACMDRMVTHLI